MKEDSQKVNSSLIFEIIGRPAGDLVTILDNVISQMNSEDGVKVLNKNIAEPKKLENKVGLAKEDKKGIMIEGNDFYSSFAEVELETDSIAILVTLIFKYMPAHVEVISPEKIMVSNSGWGGILTELVRRLHSYDELARIMQVEKTVLENKLRSLISPKIEPVSGTKKQKLSKSKPKGKKK